MAKIYQFCRSLVCIFWLLAGHTYTQATAFFNIIRLYTSTAIVITNLVLIDRESCSGEMKKCYLNHP